MEKLLLEACLEAMRSGAVVGIQDMGAAGLTCSTCEMGSRGQVGIEIDLARVPQREEGMTPYEIMLSESQERMLLVAQKDREEELLQIFRKWDLEGVVIGQVRNGDTLTVHQEGETIAQVPMGALTTEAPVYDRPAQEPGYLSGISLWHELDFAEPSDYNALLMDLVESSHLCSRRWVYQQYDHMVRTNTVVFPGSDAAVLRLKKSQGGLAISLDGNSRYCYLNPRNGAVLAAAESCRNLACSGALPLAVTNCLNFGNPENPEVMWQFIEAIRGLGQACQAFNTPVTGGNVSFYNETNGGAIFPTPVLGMVGKIDDLRCVPRSHFTGAGDRICLLGETRAELGGSVYLEHLGLPLSGPCPTIDLGREKVLHGKLLELTKRGLVKSAHDVSEGGLALSLAESCFPAKCGVRVDVKTPFRADYSLFSESASRVVVSLEEARIEEFLDTLSDFPVAELGEVTDQNFELNVNGQPLISLPLVDIFRKWDNYLDEVFQH
jgi:phosphoribosylformylglycinamidine synthase